MNNSDLLEKLALIREAVERNPDEWWREFIWDAPIDYWATVNNADILFDALKDGTELRLKPQQVRVEGWVDNDSIEWLRKQAEDMWAANRIHAKALLQLVKKEAEGD